MPGLKTMIRTTGLVIIALPLLAACQGTGGSVGVDWGEEPPPPPGRGPGPHAENMPPPHAPAHGRRAQMRQYRYYPRNGIYFDSKRGVYFYLSGDNWQVSVELPQRYRTHLGGYVMIEADAEAPYHDYDKHRAKYPPGQSKKGDHPGKGKGNGQEKWD
jgi:hypothetical protein